MINPSGHKILIKTDSIETKSAGGIIYGMLDEKMEKAGIHRGILVAFGSQAWKAFSADFEGEPWANVGDYLYYSRYAGKLIVDPIDDAEYMIMNDEDVLAVITAGSNEVLDNVLLDNKKEEEV